jgi:glyoxylase-like metal-dependent hydrolase (beta-lactamase superfamily II)
MSESYQIILAPNPSMMTGPGTNTIVLGGGSGGALVIDPADAAPAHLEAIIQAGEARGGLKGILLTHWHPDHVGGVAELRERLQIPIYAFSQDRIPLADTELPDGARLPCGADSLRALHTPGHSPDHLCYFLEKQQILFAGDLVAGTGTVVISNLYDYMHSLQRLQQMEIAEMVPAHGPVISNAHEKLAEYIAHRQQREQQIVAALRNSPPGTTIPELVAQIYRDVDPQLHPVAVHSVEAHLLKLEQEGRALREGEGWELRESQ